MKNIILKDVDVARYVKTRATFLDVKYNFLAKLIGISNTQFSQKLSGKYEFKISEIVKIENYFNEKQKQKKGDK